MFERWGRFVHRRRWFVLVSVVLLTALAGVWGAGVFDRLAEGGYDDPNGQSVHAAQVVEHQIGQPAADVVVIYTDPNGAPADPRLLSGKVDNALTALPPAAVTHHTLAGDPAHPNSRLAVLTLAGGDDQNAKVKAYDQIAGRLRIDGLTTQVGGQIPIEKSMSDRSKSDLTRAEAVSLPVTLILLVVIFGGLVAASLPVVVGGLAIAGSLGVLHLISLGTEVNSFAVNVASLLGLGLAIDYGLFSVGRFREELSRHSREELASGRAVPDAVRRTVATSGRTVAFSATLLVVALSGLLLFPQSFLKSLAYGGMSAVAIAAVVSLTVLPALFAVLGHRVDRLAVPWRRGTKSEVDSPGWWRLARGVMRRPALVAVPIIAVLLVLGAPFLSVRFGAIDQKALPANDPARQAIETLNRDWPVLGGNALDVVLQGDHNAAPAQQDVQRFAADVGNVPGVTGAQPMGSGGGAVLIKATLSGDAVSESARQALTGIRALPHPPGSTVLVGGVTARLTDSLSAIRGHLPWMAALLVGATLVLMFLAFGSVALPIKAVAMSGLSLSATFGVLVWVFQDGHGAGLLGVTPSPMEAGIVVLMAAMVFGLSTDYEVFLLSRMVEARTRGASTEDAVATGIARTGRVISAAAVLLIVVTGAFALGQISVMRFIGVGMILALALDATVVRMLLVPAVLRLLGDAAWWAPGPLRRLQQRVGIHESDDPDELPAAPAKIAEPVG